MKTRQCGGATLNRENELKERMCLFALEIIKYSEGLRGNRVLDILSRQLIRSGTSVYLNYRAVCRAKSKADFINKLAIVEEEADETVGCLELIRKPGLSVGDESLKLIKEAGELTAIVVASIKTARRSK